MGTRAPMAANSSVAKLAATLQFDSDPDVIFENASRAISDKSVANLPLSELRKLAFAAGIGSQFSIADAVDEQYTPFAVSFARQLIAEYGCKTPSEIATAEMAAVAYATFVEYSKLTKIYKRDAIYHKTVDRASRQYISAIGALRQMKRPPVAVNVIAAQTAFVAQNQQINTRETHDP